MRSAECGVRSAECGVRSAECGVRSAECGVRSVENEGCGRKMGRVENVECRKCGVWKMRSVEIFYLICNSFVSSLKECFIIS